MDVELHALNRNQTWTLVSPPFEYHALASLACEL